MRKGFICLLSFFASICLSLASDLISAKIYTVPEKPYVGQESSLYVEIVANDHCEIRNVNIGGFPVTNFVSLGELIPLPVQEKKDDVGQRYSIHLFRAHARAAAPMDCIPSPVVRLEIGRVSSGWFGSHWMWMTDGCRVDCQRLVVRDLPEEGRPDDFTGAVGDFSLELKADATEVWKDDIVNLSLALRGEGYAGTVPPAMPSLPKDLFRSYEPKVAPREDDATFFVTQSVVPLSTQAVEIASATFSYFNPDEETYKTASSDPVRLRFRKREGNAVPAVREVKVEAKVEKAHSAPTLEVTGTTLRAASKFLVPLFVSLFAGLLVVAFVHAFGMKYRYAVVVGLCVALACFPLVRQRRMARMPAAWSTCESTALRLAPSGNARVTLELPDGMEVELLEKSGNWVRVRSHGQSGWLRSTSIRQDQLLKK